MKIELKKLQKTYKGEKAALKDLSLTLASPNLIGLVGPNGAGKSTLMKLLTANLLPSSGEILVDGLPLAKQETRLKSSLGYLPQEFGLFEDLTTAQFLDYMAALKGLEKQAAKSEINRVIALTHLADKRKAKIRTLSGGQKQRVGIAQALLGDPKLLIFDEPTVGLDPAERVAFRNLFAEAAKSRLVILSTHIIEDVQSACDQLIVLDRGEVRYAGTPDALMAQKSAPSLESAYMALMDGGGSRLNAAAKFARELRRMLSERLTWLFMALTAAGAVWFSLNASGATASDAFIVNAAQNSAFLGAFLFMLLALTQFHRDFKNNTDVIVLTSTDPINHQIRRTLALICVAVVTTFLISLFALPYGMAKTGGYFQFTTFLTAWYLIFLGALVFAILLSAGVYMLTGRVEAAFLIMAGLILLSKLLENMFTLNPSYLFYWVQTTADNFSDLITNQFQIDLLLWNRLFCLLVSLGVWALGLCAFRRYGRGLFGSLFVNLRRVWLPLALIAALALSGVSFALEPIFDDSKPIDFSGMINSGTGIAVSYGGEETVGNPTLTLTDKAVELDIDAAGRSLSGVARYKLRNETGEAQSLPVLMNTGLTIDRVLINGAEGKAVRGETGESSTANWRIPLPAGAEQAVEIRYSGRMRNDNTILQRASNGISEGYIWLPTIGLSPSFDINVSDNSTFSGTLLLDDSLEPVFASGEVEKGETVDGKTTWRYTGRVGAQGTSLFAADYMTQSFEAGGLNIQLKYFRKHDQSMTDMDAVKVIKATIDYFTEVYGPLLYSERLTMLELPAYVSGGFAAGNMSAMDETNFDAEGYLPAESLSPDSGGGIDVLVHEIAHQWWGLATMPLQDESSNWSAEGITCYSTYCFMKQYFGEEYANEHDLKQWQQGFDTYKNAFYIQHPEYLAKLSDGDASNMMGAFQNIRLYDTMPLMMLKGEEALGGTEAFQQKLSELYMTHLMQPITYEDFLTATSLTKEAIELA